MNERPMSDLLDTCHGTIGLNSFSAPFGITRWVFLASRKEAFWHAVSLKMMRRLLGNSIPTGPHCDPLQPWRACS